MNSARSLSLAKNCLPDFLRSCILRCRDFVRWDRFQVKSWSQEGEDRILYRFFETKKDGFYIDVGAHHPKRFSNTYLFYQRGWRGVNIDAMPGIMALFKRERPRDVNVECAVANTKGMLTYHMFNEPALNSFSAELSEIRNNDHSGYKLVKTIQVPTYTLSEVLDKYVEEGQVIDFMSTDAEGLDYEVLLSNNWLKYRPKIILIEIISETLEDILKHKESQLLMNNGYQFYAKCCHTIFFKLIES